MLRASLKQHEAFYWVAQLGGFREAADYLNATQPAISLRIKKFENLLGVKLFEREDRPAVLTPKGQELLPLAERLLNLADQFERRAIAPKHRTGLLRIGVAETIVNTWLAEFMGVLRESFPRIGVDITVDVSVNLNADLLARKLDLCFLLGPVTDYRVENRPLNAFPMAWLAHRDLPLPTDRPLREADILPFPIITFARNTATFREIDEHFGQLFQTGYTIYPSSSLSACRRMVLDRIGVGSVPLPIALQAARERNMRILELPWTPNKHVFTASYIASPGRELVNQALQISERVAHVYQDRLASSGLARVG